MSDNFTTGRERSQAIELAQKTAELETIKGFLFSVSCVAVAETLFIIGLIGSVLMGV